MRNNRQFHIAIILLILLGISTAVINSVYANVNLYLCPPGPAYLSSINIGDNFSLDIIAESDLPGVTLIVFTVTWSPESSLKFIYPASENSSELAMTGFFPLTSPDSSRISGILPNWTTPKKTPEATPEISAYTAPPQNFTGPDSLVRVTFKKLSADQPMFSITNIKAAQYIGGSEVAWVSANFQTLNISIDAVNAQMSGRMLSRTTSVIISEGGNSYQATVSGNTWALNIKDFTPGITAQPVTIEFRQDNNILTSLTIFDIVRSPGWFESPENHSQHPGDNDGDGNKDILDLVRLGLAYGSSVGDERYDYRVDYNADGIVDHVDLLIFVYHGR